MQTHYIKFFIRGFFLRTAHNFFKKKPVRFVLLFLFLLVSTGFSLFKADYAKVMDFNLNTTTAFQNTKMGGLSGLSLYQGKHYAVSDDRGKFAEPRVYVFNLNLDLGKTLSAQAERVIFLKNEDGKNFIENTLDPEGIVVSDDGMFIISEGDINSKPRVNPEIIWFLHDGKKKANLPVPDYFFPDKVGEPKKGVRNNLAFEGLSLCPDSGDLVVATENSLVQDGPISGFLQAGTSRILVYKKKPSQDISTKKENQSGAGEGVAASSWVVDQEYLYPISALTKPSDLSVLLGSGVSEIKCLQGGKLLVIERAAILTGTEVKNIIEVFNVDLKGAKPLSVEVKEKKSFSEGAVAPAQFLLGKKLFLNLSDFTSAFKGPKTLDNIEAIEWGAFTNEKKALLFLSDDNFSAKQRTLWLSVEVEGIE